MPYALALLITLAVEVPLYAVVLRLANLLRWPPAVAGALGVNLLTHPLVWLLLSAHPGAFLPVEASVCLVEALLLWLLCGRQALLLLLAAAVFANTASVAAGAVLYGQFG